jgi:hypothetical protein
MKLFGTRKITIDERIVNTKNRIYKEAYIIVMAICFISIAVKYYLYGYSVGLAITELLIITISSLYFTIRSVLAGLYSDEVEIHDRSNKTPMSVKSIVIGISFGVVMALFFGIRSSILYADNNSQHIWYFITVFFVSLIIFCPLFVAIVGIPYFIGSKASKKLNSKNED